MTQREETMIRPFGFLATLMLAQGLYCSPVFASDTLHHTKFWNSAGISGSISADKRVKYYFEPNLRFVDEPEIFDRAYLDAALGYQLIPTLVLWLGTEWESVKSSNDVIEHQLSLWQQINWAFYSNTHFSLSDRTRMEERYRFTASGVSLRFRERVELEIPLGSEKKYSLVLNNELLINVNNPPWVSNTLMDQNRALLALRTRLNKQISFDIGYLNQYEYKSTNEQSNVVCLAVGIQND